nr:hypothetical protein [Tanacetum cinerariifolium]
MLLKTLQDMSGRPPLIVYEQLNMMPATVTSSALALFWPPLPLVPGPSSFRIFQPFIHFLIHQPGSEALHLSLFATNNWASLHHKMQNIEVSNLATPEQAPPSPDYVPGPKHLPSHNYVPGLEYLEYLVPSDDEEDPKQNPEEDPANYPADGGDEEEEEEEASEEEEDEEKEHLALTDSTLPAIDPVPSAKETESFKTDESAATPPPPRSPQTMVPFPDTRLRRARIFIRPHTPPSPSAEARIAKYTITPTPPSPPPSSLSPLSSSLPKIPSPPLHTSPTYADAPLCYRAAIIYLRATSPLHVPSPPLHVPSSPLLLPSANRRSDIPETNMPFRKRLCLTALASRVMIVVEEVNERVTYLATTQRHDAHEQHVRDEDAQDDQALLRAQISLLTRERERERERSMTLEDSIKTLEAQVRTLQTQHDKMEWQRQDACDLVTSAFGRIHALEARDRKMAPKKTTTPMIDAAIKELIAQGVADALAEYETNRSSRNGDDSHDSGSGRRTKHATRECTYSDFLKYKPLNFTGTKGVVGLTQCALTWWNSYVKTVGHDVPYGMK